MELLIDVIFFFSPKYFISQQSGCLILRSRQRDEPGKYQLVHRDDPKLCPKSVQRYEHCRKAFKATDILLVKTVNRQDRLKEKV